MAVGLSLVAFVVGAVVSLATSWVLVLRLERVGERLGLSEALLGMAAALAADAPEITASVTALLHHQQAVIAGVVVGSNVFNLAALLGLGAVVSGGIALHRKVVLLGGTVAMAVLVVGLLAVAGVASAGVGLLVALVVIVPYIVLLGTRHGLLGRLNLPPQWLEWLASAVVEEEAELEVTIHPQHGTSTDTYVVLAALVTVVGASVAMEQGATSLGAHYGVADIVVGALVLAAVTSLPNAVAAVFLARRGRGAAGAEHGPQLQHDQLGRRVASTGGCARLGPAVGLRASHRGLVRRDYRLDTAVGLPGPRPSAFVRLAHYRRICSVRRGSPGQRLTAKTWRPSNPTRSVRRDQRRLRPNGWLCPKWEASTLTAIRSVPMLGKGRFARLRMTRWTYCEARRRSFSSARSQATDDPPRPFHRLARPTNKATSKAALIGVVRAPRYHPDR